MRHEDNGNQPCAARQTGANAANRRRKRLVSPRAQWKLATWVMAVTFLPCVVMGAGLLLVQDAYLRSQVFTGRQTGMFFPVLLVFAFGLGFALIATAGFGFWSLRCTHRVFGPLTVVADALCELRRGRFPRRRALRKHDECKDLYALLCDTVETLEMSKRDELAAYARALAALDELADHCQATRRDALDRAVKEIDALRRQTADALGEPAPSVGQKPSKERQPAAIGAR